MTLLKLQLSLEIVLKVFNRCWYKKDDYFFPENLRNKEEFYTKAPRSNE